MENQATIGRYPALQLLLRSGEELRRHGVGGAIRGGRRSMARYPQTGDFITNVSARPWDEGAASAVREVFHVLLRAATRRATSGDGECLPRGILRPPPGRPG